MEKSKPYNWEDEPQTDSIDATRSVFEDPESIDAMIAQFNAAELDHILDRFSIAEINHEQRNVEACRLASKSAQTAVRSAETEAMLERVNDPELFAKLFEQANYAFNLSGRQRGWSDPFLATERVVEQQSLSENSLDNLNMDQNGEITLNITDLDQ